MVSLCNYLENYLVLETRQWNDWNTQLILFVLTGFSLLLGQVD